MSCWPTSSPIVYREVWRSQVWTARAVTVVQDSPELVALYLAPGTQWKFPAPLDGDNTRADLLRCLATGRWQLIDTTWPWGDTLLLVQPGAAHAVHVMWRAASREFAGWYVNLQEPLRRTPSGFDFMDQALDIVVAPDLSGWRWKDEDEFQSAQKSGVISAEQARAIRAEGERVIARVRNRASPFGDNWENWVPDPTWPLPGLPPDWDKLA